MIEEIVKDFLIGDKKYWKIQFNKVINQIKSYEPQNNNKKNMYFKGDTDKNMLFICGINLMSNLYPPTTPRVIWNTFFNKLYLYLLNNCDEIEYLNMIGNTLSFILNNGEYYEEAESE